MPEETQFCGPIVQSAGAYDPVSESLKLENQLFFPLYAAARKVVSLYTPYFKPLGITYTQYIAFLVLWEKHTISIRELCRILYLDSGTLTPMLKKMEEAGYIIRRRCSEDERVVLVSLTEQGEKLRERAAEIPARVGTCVPLEPEETFTLYKLLYKLLGKKEE